jgi:ubiquinone biosynthesis protein COQ9
MRELSLCRLQASARWPVVKAARAPYICPMMASETTAFISDLANAARKLAATRPWQDISLRDLCVSADVTLAACAQEGVTKAHIAAKLDSELDQALLANAHDIDQSQSVRDRLFDVVMGRYDAMEEHRAGWQSILNGELGDPLARVARQARRTHTASWALEACGITASDMRGAGQSIGLARIIRQCDKQWCEDGPDLAKTMAFLDQELRKSEAWVERANKAWSMMERFGLSGLKARKAKQPVED